MTKVHAVIPDSDFRSFVGEDILRQRVRYCYAVKRPLDIPCARHKIGIVLAHAGIVCITEEGASVLVEYMFGSKIHITNCTTYKPGEDFVFRSLPFVHVTKEPQRPNKPVTVKELAKKMADIMRGKSFQTYTHNCHEARYFTMRYYGMKSKDPASESVNVFFQGVLDYFQK